MSRRLFTSARPCRAGRAQIVCHADGSRWFGRHLGARTEGLGVALLIGLGRSGLATLDEDSSASSRTTASSTTTVTTSSVITRHRRGQNAVVALLEVCRAGASRPTMTSCPEHGVRITTNLSRNLGVLHNDLCNGLPARTASGLQGVHMPETQQATKRPCGRGLSFNEAPGGWDCQAGGDRAADEDGGQR
jgi:hypothetical protein